MLQSDVAARPHNLKIPACSADWRFLLPMDGQLSVLVVTPSCDEYGVSFDAINVHNATQHVDDFAARRGRSESHDVVAFPLGIPAGLSASVDQILDGARAALKPSGAILFGFANRRGLRGRGQSNNHFSSTPREMERALRKRGFSAPEIYCAFPDLQTPEYIFSPFVADLQFILHRRYRHKLPAPLLNLMASPTAARFLLGAVPFYYAVAYRADVAR